MSPVPRTRQLLALALLALVNPSILADDSPSSASATETTTTTATSTPEQRAAANPLGATNDKIARRIIEDRLTPPRATDLSSWNRRLPAAEAHRTSGGGGGSIGPPVDEEVVENADDRSGGPKKTRTVLGSPLAEQDPTICCAGKSSAASAPGGGFAPLLKERPRPESLMATDVERGGVGGSGGLRFHGSIDRPPMDDRYGHGWRSSSYLGFGKDKGFYDPRSRYPYDRYNAEQRPSANYALDGDRYGAQQRPSNPNNYGPTDNDRFGTSSNRPGSSGGGYHSANYGYPGDRPRPSNYGISGSLMGGEGDTDYPFGEGGSGQPVSGSGLPANLQTQKAVALKALAGVALIGAAAALATNPVLLPIGAISGRRRRRRSAALEADDYALTALLHGYIMPKPNEVAAAAAAASRSDGVEDGSASSGDAATATTTTSGGQRELVITPQCVARLACHVHRDYLDDLERSRAELSAEEQTAAFQGLENWFDSLIHSNILVADHLSDELKTLIRSAVNVGSNRDASCDVFSCINSGPASAMTTKA